MRVIRSAGGIAVLLAVVTAVYSNHFYNAFHFDDFHTVTENIHIRKLGNVGRFFTDPATFSILPTHQVYRPVVTTSLALDYWLAQGLHPFAFHATTFCWYAIQLVLLYLLYIELLGGSRLVALFGAALYGVHPVAAETVNYVIQRAELYSTLGLIAALLLYIRKPDWRRYGIYLFPFALACLSKPPALVFPALLFLYVWLYEAGGARRAVRATLPALGVAAALAALLQQMTAASLARQAPSRVRPDRRVHRGFPVRQGRPGRPGPPEQAARGCSLHPALRWQSPTASMLRSRRTRRLILLRPSLP